MILKKKGNKAYEHSCVIYIDRSVLLQKTSLWIIIELCNILLRHLLLGVISSLSFG